MSSGHLQSGERPDRDVRAGMNHQGWLCGKFFPGAPGAVRNGGNREAASRGVSFSFAYFFWTSKRNRLVAPAGRVKRSLWDEGYETNYRN